MPIKYNGGRENPRCILFYCILDVVDLDKKTPDPGALSPEAEKYRRFGASEEYRGELVGGMLQEKNWQGLSDFLDGLEALQIPFWVDYFCAAVDEHASAEDFVPLRAIFEKHEIFDYPLLMQLHRLVPGDDAVQLVFYLALGILRHKPTADGYYYRLAVLRDAFRLGLAPVEVINTMDVDAVEYIVARLSAPNVGRYGPLRAALEHWQAGVGQKAGEMERYFALRLCEMACMRHRGAYKTDPDGTIERYRLAVERRFAWENEHRAEGLCENGGAASLPAGVRAVCWMHEAFTKWDEGQLLGALVALRNAVMLDMFLAEVAMAMGDRLTAQLRRQVKEGAVEDSEFDETLLSVKNKIERMIDAGYPQIVIASLNELERMMPGDNDIISLKIKAGLLPPS